MKLAITEYNNGGGQHIAGTLAQGRQSRRVSAHTDYLAANMWLLTPKETVLARRISGVP